MGRAGREGFTITAKGNDCAVSRFYQLAQDE